MLQSVDLPNNKIGNDGAKALITNTTIITNIHMTTTTTTNDNNDNDNNDNDYDIINHSNTTNTNIKRPWPRH